MISFGTYITEQKNTHMTHLEDQVIYGGVKGARDAILALRSLRDMLAGSSTKAVDVTVKWDGAPAVFAGIDPSDGQFFVAKKGIFNKNPMVYKNHAEIEADTSGDLQAKLKIAFTEMSKLGITGVVQGDVMFSGSHVKTETIDGKNLELVINWECAKKEYHVLNLHTEELEDAEMLVQGIRLLQEESVAIP